MKSKINDVQSDSFVKTLVNFKTFDKFELTIKFINVGNKI